MSDEEIEVEIPKGDPNPTRLLETVMDRLDKVLVKQGFEFRDDRSWEEACSVIEKFVFKFYDDLTGGDEDYDPKKALKDSSSEAVCVDAASSDEDEEELDEEEEEEEGDEASPEPKKAKKNRK